MKQPFCFLMVLIFASVTAYGQIFHRLEKETAEEFALRLKPDSLELAHKVIETASWGSKGRIIIAFYNKPMVHIFSDPVDTIKRQYITGVLYIATVNNRYQKAIIDTLNEYDNVESVFFANADRDSDLELVILFSTEPDINTCKCSGTYYDTRIYDKPNFNIKVEKLKYLERISVDVSGGFEGVARWDKEEQKARFKTATEIKKELRRLGYK